MEKKLFGKTTAGQEVYVYNISNGDVNVTLTDLGAAVVDIWMKDKNDNAINVSLSYDRVLPYEEETTYFGAIVGPNANRIADARFELDGVIYELDKNDNENSLHSGYQTMAKKVWSVKEHTEDRIVFAYKAKDLEQGFPGNISCEVTYEITKDKELVISYYALSDKKTILNMTNHTYFNLNGALSGNVEDHMLWIKASHYTPVKSAKAIPTGEIAPVEGTPFDFREPKAIGRDINEPHEQLIFGQGYDHNFAIDKETEGMEKVATVYASESGIEMDVWTDCIGVQLYTGNFVGGQIGPNGHSYVKRAGLCLETQFFPNAINESNFVNPIVDANVPYETKTIYTFRCKE